MSWISEERESKGLAKEKSKGRLSASFYPDSVWRAAAGVANVAAPGARWEEHRRLLPLMINSNPQPVPPRPPRGLDFELVRCGFSHRSNWMSIAAISAFLPPDLRILRMALSAVNLLLW